MYGMDLINSASQRKLNVLVVILLIFLTLMSFLFVYSDTQNILYLKHSYFITNNCEDSQINEADVAEGFIVSNPSCHIPDIEPYHESIKKYIFKWTPLICSKNKPLTSVVYNPATKRHTLTLNSRTINPQPRTLAPLICCYSLITRSHLTTKHSDGDDDRYEMGNETCFKSKAILPARTEYIFVSCSSDKREIYKTIHFMVTPKQPKPVAPHVELPQKKFSVFMFAIDSISRLNFIRTLPKTRKHIEDRGWLPLEGYTKIADNTFPNLVAILSGMNVDQLTKLCYPSDKAKLDDCPFMWKNFSQNGYLTSYTEDAAHMGSFNFEKYGFMNSPTDYYSRPILMAARKLMNVQIDGEQEYCIGSQPQIEYLFQFNTEFIQRFHDQPYFNLFWSNSYSHNKMNMPSVMDDRIQTFLQDIEPYLNSTVVVFFSDHGIRFGKARETYIGWLEERMPFIYFYLPPSFKATYPEAYQNLRVNKNRLTSPFDLHITLQQLLHDQHLQPAAGCSKCGSLLAPVPYKRSCDDAGIASHWCTCSVENHSESVSDPRIRTAAHMAVSSVNEFLHKTEDHLSQGYKCATLSLAKVMTVRTKGGSANGFEEKQEHIIVFETDPSRAVFEVTVPEDSLRIDSVEQISRINLYGSQSSCVDGSNLLKLFCYCVKQ